MINLLVALNAEARPLIRHLGLKQQTTARGFRLYTRADINLTVCGSGRLAAASGTCWLAAITQSQRDTSWLNIGSAGHANRQPGTGLIVERLRDSDDTRNRYPAIPSGWAGAGTDLVTVTKPETTYPQDSAYDMEASAFYDSAARFSLSDLICCYKIVSDNPAHSPDTLDASQLEQLVAHQLPDVEMLIEALRESQAPLMQDRLLIQDWQQRLVSGRRFSNQEQIRLSRLIQRALALHQTSLLQIDIDLPTRQAHSRWLNQLENQIDAVASGFTRT